MTADRAHSVLGTLLRTGQASCQRCELDFLLFLSEEVEGAERLSLAYERLAAGGAAVLSQLAKPPRL